MQPFETCLREINHLYRIKLKLLFLAVLRLYWNDGSSINIVSVTANSCSTSNIKRLESSECKQTTKLLLQI